MCKIMVAAALAVLIASPALGQTRQGHGWSTDGTWQAPRTRPGKSAKRTAGPKPCAARTWAGCQGWDPDPNVRSMIQMDAGRDDR
jgi:hypothetical protein